MQERIPQSVAKRVPFKVYLSADHVTAAEGKTIAMQISKNGAAFTNLAAGATNATETGSGWYYVDLAIADTDTLGPLVARGTEATIDPAEMLCEVTADLATVAADIAAVKAETALIYADTDDLQTSQGDWATADVSGLATTTALAAVKAETVLIVADTGELQTDWANGGRLDLILDSILADTSAMGGAGSNECTITVSDGDGDPIDGCSVWITTDEAGKNVVASGTTDESGVVTFMLDGGTYFSWRQLSGFNFDNPETIVVGA